MQCMQAAQTEEGDGRQAEAAGNKRHQCCREARVRRIAQPKHLAERKLTIAGKAGHADQEAVTSGKRRIPSVREVEGKG